MESHQVVGKSSVETEIGQMASLFCVILIFYINYLRKQQNQWPALPAGYVNL